MGKCQVCGKTTKLNFPLCKEHYDLKEQGKIIQCPDCGKWNEKDVVCECKKIKEESKIENELTCIICGEPSNGKHFCIKCWNTYKDKSVDLRITNCKEIEILDQYGNLTIECDDGRKVRSRAEALISNFFYNNKIPISIIKPCFYNSSIASIINFR